jgi:hypothetical protein
LSTQRIARNRTRAPENSGEWRYDAPEVC